MNPLLLASLASLYSMWSPVLPLEPMLNWLWMAWCSCCRRWDEWRAPKLNPSSRPIGKCWNCIIDTALSQSYSFRWGSIGKSVFLPLNPGNTRKSSFWILNSQFWWTTPMLRFHREPNYPWKLPAELRWAVSWGKSSVSKGTFSWTLKSFNDAMEFEWLFTAWTWLWDRSPPTEE